jgi:hypothetical protein
MEGYDTWKATTCTSWKYRTCTFEELDLHSLVVTSVSQARHVQLGEQLVKAKDVLVEAFGESQLRLFACGDTLESFDA